MATLSLLVCLLLRCRHTLPPNTAPPRLLAALALLTVITQIALGGWVSSNYAALACPDFPLCQAQWQPAMDFFQAFSVHRDLGYTAQGELLSSQALTAIHWTHRLGAIAVMLTVGALALALLRTGERRWRNWGKLLLVVLLLQIGLGISNVLLALPLALAVAHNLGAAALLTAVLAVTIQCSAAHSRKFNPRSALRQSVVTPT